MRIRKHPYFDTQPRCQASEGVGIPEVNQSNPVNNTVGVEHCGRVWRRAEGRPESPQNQRRVPWEWEYNNKTPVGGQRPQGSHDPQQYTGGSGDPRALSRPTGDY